MKTTRIVSALLIMGLIFCAGCTQDQPPAPEKQKQATPALQKPKPAAAAAWPFLREDEQAAKLAPDFTAKNYLLIFDGSGSMRESQCAGNRLKIDVAKEAVMAWAETVPADANLGFYAFYFNGESSLPLAVNNRDAFNQEVKNVNAGGRTPLSEAMAYAYDEMTKQAKQQLGYGEYTIVVVTDGMANDGNRLKQIVYKILQNTPINIFSIGFCIGQEHVLNQAGQTMYHSATNPEQLQQGLQEVLAESESFDEADFSN